MALPPPPGGWSRFLVKGRFGAGRDFAVLDPGTEQQRFFVDGKIGTPPKAEIRDSADAVVYQVRGRLLGVPKHMTISDAAGQVGTPPAEHSQGDEVAPLAQSHRSCRLAVTRVRRVVGALTELVEVARPVLMAQGRELNGRSQSGSHRPGHPARRSRHRHGVRATGPSTHASAADGFPLSGTGPKAPCLRRMEV